jgi:nitrous oxidase accessory protein NosD
MNVGDVILLDAGTYVGTSISGAANTGVIIIGSIDDPAIISSPLTISNVDRLTVSRLTTNTGILVNNATQTTLQENAIRNAGVAISGGNNVQVLNNAFFNASTAVMVSGDTQAPVIASNTIRDGLRGVWLTSGATAQAASSIIVRDNHILGASTGIAVETVAQGRISTNWIDDATIGLRLTETFAGLITNNIVSNSYTGALYAAPNTLDGNLIYGGNTGVSTSVSTTTGGFGYFGSSSTNRIVNNNTGIALSQNAIIQKQYLWGNDVGVTGTGSIIPTGFEFANTIGGSTTAVDVSGTVQYTRMERNATGIAARSSQLIAHNEFVDNSVGIDINGDNDVRVFANTMVGTAGTNVRLRGSSSQVEVRNNILWTDSGTNLFVDNNSTSGFFSDYNTYIAGSTGSLIYWTKNFKDILDWQEDVYRFDLHSAGTTVVNPRAAEPRFVSRSLNDYRVFDQVARLRFTSPTIDIGDPLADQARSPDFVNLLVNPSFEQGLNSWTVTPATSNLGTSSPSGYDGTNYFRGGTGSTVLLEQTVDLVAAGILGLNACHVS